MSDENDRLRALLTAQDSRIRELEEALAKCHQIGVRLSEVLTYIRDDEPSAAQMQSMAREALD